MNSRTTEILVGVFMLLFFGAMLVLALRVSDISGVGRASGYTLTAEFENVGGLKVGAPVSAGGVRVGQVEAIEYDSEIYSVLVTMGIDGEYAAFPEDTTASIYTAGLLGEQYVGFEPGAEDIYLADGDTMELTQSALVLERLIGQVLFSRSGSE